MLLLAVAVLYFLHFSPRVAAPVVATDKSMAILASPEPAASSASVAVATPGAPALAVAAPAATTSTAGQIVYVESGKMLDGYQGMKDARKAFESKARGWEKQNQTMLAGFKANVEGYQKQAPTLSAEQRAAT